MAEMMNEPKLTVAYTIKRFANGDVEVDNADIEGAEDLVKLSSEALYKDIEDVAETIRLKRIENAAYSGVVRFFRVMQAQEEAAMAPQEPDITIE